MVFWLPLTALESPNKLLESPTTVFLFPTRVLVEPYKAFSLPKMILSFPLVWVLLDPTTVVFTPLIVFWFPVISICVPVTLLRFPSIVLLIPANELFFPIMMLEREVDPVAWTGCEGVLSCWDLIVLAVTLEMADLIDLRSVNCRGESKIWVEAEEYVWGYIVAVLAKDASIISSMDAFSLT